jgi:dihydroflavonol-4-reductase
MKAAITGATGLVGGNLAESLLRDGVEVRATKRGSSRVEHLNDLSIEWVEAPLGDVEKLAAAFRGVDVVFHCAAEVSQTRASSGAHRQGNVAGTQSVLDAVRAARVPRLVHCSSVVACAVAKPGGPDVTEDDPWNFDAFGLSEEYAVSKREAERLVIGASDVDAVVVNPGYMIGPRDSKPSSGRMITSLATGELFAAPSGMNSFVDVRDVCRGMIAAWRKGRRGERYILAGVNMSYREAFTLFCDELGRRPPPPVPDVLVHLTGRLGDLAEMVLRRPLELNTAVARYSTCREYRFSSAKAMRELGWELSPLRQAARDAIAWFRARGMI